MLNTREQLLELAYADAPLTDSGKSKEIYDYLTEEMENSDHGKRFLYRDFSMRPIDNERPSALDINSPYIVTNKIDPDQQKWIAETVCNLIMRPADSQALKEAVSETYYSEEARKIRRLGGSVVLISNHLTYADIIAESAAMTLARLEVGEENPNESQDIIAHRLTSLFQHPLIQAIYKEEGIEDSQGNILEDIILQFAGNLQTMPYSNSGYAKFVERVKEGGHLRSQLNQRTATMFNRLLRLGGRNFFVAGAGTQSIFNEETGLTEEQRVGRGTCDMLTKPNEIEGSERLLAVPIYIHIDPFSKANETIPVHPQPTPFAILEPTYLRKPSDVHGMMSDIVKVGNELKPENSPEITYDLPGPDWAHRKRPTPKLITSHKV